MSRYLAVDRCIAGGHLLAWVVEQDGRILVVVRTSSWDMVDGKAKRMRKKPYDFGRLAADIGESESALATCGCRRDHNVDVSGLVARARHGDTAPRMVPSV